MSNRLAMAIISEKISQDLLGIYIHLSFEVTRKLPFTHRKNLLFEDLKDYFDKTWKKSFSYLKEKSQESKKIRVKCYLKIR